MPTEANRHRWDRNDTEVDVEAEAMVVEVDNQQEQREQRFEPFYQRFLRAQRRRIFVSLFERFM